MSCPCLYQHAVSPSVRIVGGQRIVVWTCGICGEFNSEESEYPPKRDADVGQAHGGALGRGSSEVVMDPTVSPHSPTT